LKSAPIVNKSWPKYASSAKLRAAGTHHPAKLKRSAREFSPQRKSTFRDAAQADKEQLEEAAARWQRHLRGASRSHVTSRPCAGGGKRHSAESKRSLENAWRSKRWSHQSHSGGDRRRFMVAGRWLQFGAKNLRSSCAA
jgi:hypothetical protein